MPVRSAADTLTRVRGVRVGQAESENGASGVTAILFDRGAPTVVDVRGGASGTFDTASLALDATFGRRWALFFAGGSLFGLDAARGIRRHILEQGGGVQAFPGASPIVPISGAILFDLPKDPNRIPDYDPIGHQAASAASRAPVRFGSVGAGAGATIGKYLGRGRAAKGGIGSATADVGRIGRIGVLVAINAVGAIRDPSTGAWVAGPVSPGGRVVPPEPHSGRAGQASRGTSLIAVVTDVRVERAVLQRIAVFAHDGLARVVDPAHTSTDGDVVFVSTTGLRSSKGRDRYPGETADRLGSWAARLVVESVLAAARASNLNRKRGDVSGRSHAGS